MQVHQNIFLSHTLFLYSDVLMSSHDREKMGYWYLQNQKKADLELKPIEKKCSRCWAVIRPGTPSFPAILDTDGKIICKQCFDRGWKKIKKKS